MSKPCLAVYLLAYLHACLFIWELPDSVRQLPVVILPYWPRELPFKLNLLCPGVSFWIPLPAPCYRSPPSRCDFISPTKARAHTCKMHEKLITAIQSFYLSGCRSRFPNRPPSPSDPLLGGQKFTGDHYWILQPQGGCGVNCNCNSAI